MFVCWFDEIVLSMNCCIHHFCSMDGTALHCSLIPVTYSLVLLLCSNVLGAVLHLPRFLASEYRPLYLLL